MLKEKQAKRKEIRAEQEKKLNQKKKEVEEKARKEEAEKKALEAEEKKKLLEEAEAKRQDMLAEKKAASGPSKKASSANDPNDARKEMSKTKEQLEEEKKIALSIRIKPLDLAEMTADQLKNKAEELFNILVQMETDKYDFEQKKINQAKDLAELKERQKAQLRQKAVRKGLDPDALSGNHPPKIRMYSKYERRQTPGPMATGSSISKVDMRLKDQRFLKPPGRRSMKNGLRGPSEDCPSGSVNDQERKLVIPRASKMARKELKEPHQRMRSLKKKKRKRRRKKKRRKNNSRTSQLLIHIKHFSKSQIMSSSSDVPLPGDCLHSTVAAE